MSKRLDLRGNRLDKSDAMRILTQGYLKSGDSWTLLEGPLKSQIEFMSMQDIEKTYAMPYLIFRASQSQLYMLKPFRKFGQSKK